MSKCLNSEAVMRTKMIKIIAVKMAFYIYVFYEVELYILCLL